MKGYREVKVTLSGQHITCHPDPAVLYYRTGPDCLRFTFPGMSKNVQSVVVRWKDGKRPLFSGMGSAPSSVGSHLPDLITRDNCQVDGRYSYAVELYDDQGKLVAEVDPEVDNQPDPP